MTKGVLLLFLILSAAGSAFAGKYSSAQKDSLHARKQQRKQHKRELDQYLRRGYPSTLTIAPCIGVLASYAGIAVSADYNRFLDEDGRFSMHLPVTAIATDTHTPGFEYFGNVRIGRPAAPSMLPLVFAITLMAIKNERISRSARKWR